MGALLSLLVWFYVHFEMKRRIKPEDIVYQEWFRCCLRLTTIWSRLIGGNNSYKFIFLKDRLILRAHFPFSAIAFVNGLDFEIPYENITKVTRGSLFAAKRIYLEFQGPKRVERVMLIASNADKVMELLNQYTRASSSIAP